MRAFAEPARPRSRRAEAARAAAPPAEVPRASAPHTARRAALRSGPACACGGGCPRCLESSPPARNSALLAPEKRPEVVVEPKTELKTPAFASDPELVKVMRGKRYVSYGNVGDYVRLIQEALLSSEAPGAGGGRTRLPKHGVDGVFGPETKAAVEEFQREYGLKPDGIVGQQTLYWLDDTFRTYPRRPDPAPDKKLPDRFAAKAAGLAPPKSFDVRMQVTKAVTADPLGTPALLAGVGFTASVEGATGDKVFYVQNIRRVERKIHWRRTEDCTADCEQARAFVGKAQGLDSSLPYGGPFMLKTGEAVQADSGDDPAHVANAGFNPRGDFKKGDRVTLFAHDQFRMFFAQGAGGALDFSSFATLGFFDWEWRGKALFTFDGATWTAGPVERRIDPRAVTLDRTSAHVYLGPLYTADDIDTNLRSSRTKIDEKPDSW